MNKIHSTAIIGENCIIGENVSIGAYTVIADNVKIANNNIIFPSVFISGNTDIGEGNKIYPFCSIGSPPQDLKFKGEKSYLYIGNSNTFREHCTVNPGTTGGGLKTQIGNNSLFMTGAHIAHDCTVGNETVFANQATLGGHVIVEDNAILGGLSAVHQFCRIGCLAMVGGMSAVENDVIPYGLALGNRAKLTGINIVGLRRSNFRNEEIKEFMKVFSQIFLSNSIESESLMFEDSNNFLVRKMIKFLNGNSSRGICQYAKK